MKKLILILLFFGILFSGIAYGSTTISNNIINDTVWTPAGSPYVVTQSIDIYPGVTLAVQPGVVVKFAQGANLDVYGTLVAMGTADAMIIFTSNQPTPAKGDWGGIVFQPGAVGTTGYCPWECPPGPEGQYYGGGSIIEFAEISYGKGIKNEQNISLWFRFNRILNNNESGIYNVGDSFISGNTISGNTSSASYSSGGGIYNQGNSTISNNTISGNTSSASAAGIANPSYSGGGIYNQGNSTISNNTISGNISSVDWSYSSAYSGGGLANVGDSTITNNIISGNASSASAAFANWSSYSGGGIYNQGNSAINNNTISGNTSFASSGSGGGLTNVGASTITSNIVSGNTSSGGSGSGGIYNQGNSAINNNTISGNTSSNGGTYPSYSGGGICNQGNSAINNNTISGNTSSGGASYSGGGLTNVGASTITSNIISGNASSFGWYSGGGLTNVGASTITSNIISGNTSSSDEYSGGGITNVGASIIASNIISGNTSSASSYDSYYPSYSGGGIYNQGNSTISNNTISGNASSSSTSTSVNPSSSGGGIYNQGVSIISANTVRNNKSLLGTVVTGSTIYLATSGSSLENNDIFCNLALYGISSVPLASFTGNNIVNSDTLYSFYYSGLNGNDQAASGNYWGTANANDIDNWIYDYWDSMSLGKVLYQPFNLAPIDHGQNVMAACDWTPPVAGVVTPSNHGVAGFVSGTFDLTTVFTDSESAVTSCEYTVDGSIWDTAEVTGGGPAYTCTKYAIMEDDGTQLTLNMRATSDGGIQAGQPVAVTVDALPPVYSWISPAAGTFVDGDSITVSVVVTDAGSGIADGTNCNPLLDDSTDAFTGTVLYSANTGKCNGVITLKKPSGLIGGTHILTVQVSDKVGNSALSPDRTISVRESNPPTGTIHINGGVAVTKSTAVTLALTAIDDSPGAIQMCISNATTCTLWTAFAATKSWTLTTGTGTKTVYVKFKDVWGNANASPYSASIILDTAAPTNGTVIPIAGNTQVTLNWSGFTDTGSSIDSYKVVYSTGSAPTSCSTGTTIYTGTDTSYPHTGLINGMTYYYRVCAIDKAGNMSTGTTASAKPVLETNPPAGSITINNGAEWTKSTAVTLTLTATDDSPPMQMCISNTTTCTTWIPYLTPKTWTLLTGNGTKTVYVWFKDIWGNATPVATPNTDTIKLDMTAPVNGTVTATPGAGQIGLSWTVFTDALSGTVGYKVVYATGAAPASCTAGTPAPGYDGTSTSYTHTGLINQTYGYRVCAIDKAGNISTGVTKTAKPLPTETNPPTGSITINSGAEFTKSASVTLTLAASDDSLPVKMCISNTTSCTTWAAFAATKTWTLTTGNGTKTVNVWFRDTWGNTTPTVTPYKDAISLDTTAPTNGIVTATAGAGQIQLSWSGFSDALSGIANYKVVYGTGSAPASCAAGTVVPGYDGTSTSYTHTGLINATYGYRVCAIDKAGNTSTGATKSAKPL